MADPAPGPPPMRLKAWLIAQVESGRYPGLRWEDADKRMFRIPWKHAAKQDYRQHEDAALFKAWAIYKGKYHEGQDRADPSVWKTRLRCALNKSSDFREVPERSHLDISEPYKVYRIVSESEDAAAEESPDVPLESKVPSTPVLQDTSAKCKPSKAGTSSETGHDVKDMKVETRVNSPVTSPSSQKSNPTEYQDYQVKGFFCSWDPAQFHFHPGASFIYPRPTYADGENNNSDCWLHICLYYCDVLVKEVTTNTAEGCRITYGCVPADNERLYGPSGMQQIHFPPPGVLAWAKLSRAVGVLEQLLPHLHRGLLLWVAPEGVFMKRQCQGRVYWKGPLAPHGDQPNKMEREKTYKMLDTKQFLQQLRGYLSHGEPLPQYQIQLCFGEEFPAAPHQKLHKFIMAQVEPVFARELCLHAQRLGPRSLRNLQACALDAPRNLVQILKQLCPP